jgi:hypothetical protein
MNFVEPGIEVVYEDLPVVDEAVSQSLWERGGGEGPRPHLMRVVRSNRDAFPVGTMSYFSRHALTDPGFMTEEPAP